MKPAGGILMVMACLAAAAGCHGPARRTADGPLVPSTRPYETDIPVPDGFVLSDRSSEDWQSGPVRYLRHEYRGRADKYAVRQFYRDYMPRVRWSLIRDSASRGRYIMLLHRGEESCQITIEDANDGADQTVLIEVKIAPGDRRNTLKSGQ